MIFQYSLPYLKKEENDGDWKMIHGQRSTGRKPDERPPYFD